MARAFWSGQLQISLVSFGIKLFPATEAKSEIRFHQLSRSSGERVRHQKVAEGDTAPVEKEDIVKGYEYRKGEYIQIEPEEIEHLRVPSRHNLEIAQFVKMDEIPTAMLEKPYFVLPEDETQAEAFAVVRKALAQSGRAGIGTIAFGGREHIVAIAAPQDGSLPGMMGYTLRYASELRSASEYFSEIKKVSVDTEQLSLAEELIRRKTAKFNPAKFTDGYETALHELVEAKLKHKPLPKEEKPAKRGKTVSLMDALRRSVSEKKPASRAASKPKHGLALVKTQPPARRKSA